MAVELTPTGEESRPDAKPGRTHSATVEAIAAPGGERILRRRGIFGTGSARNAGLIVCGVASALLYALMIWAVRYEGYDHISQVAELS
jgi:hypothetical protein